MVVWNQPRRVGFVAGLLSMSLLTACASSLTEDERVALRYERAEREDSIREFVAGCEAAGHSVLYTGPTYQKLRNPVKHVPSHARLTDYQCVTQAALDRFLTGGS